ncbi:MAG: DUF3667 domain-containing protein [Cyclobacteriaceae bacterium]|nr:DUF3667 domain-containing protein [Cyclobacteriaceae bacterium]
MPCVNCGADVTGAYCSNCGQRATVKRLTLREGWNDFWARIYGFDGMFPRTLRDLTIRPGKASLKFIERNRVAYYGPVGYFFLTITLMYLIASLLGVNMVDFMKNSAGASMQAPPKPGTGQEKFMEELMKVVSENMKLVSFAIVPIQAFYSRYLFFRKSNLNFIEHTVLPFYTLGHIYWISILSLLSYSILGKFIPAWIQLVVSFGYFGFAYADMFTYQNRIKAFLKGLGIYILAQITFTIIGIIVGVIVVLLNPELFEMIRPSNN